MLKKWLSSLRDKFPAKALSLALAREEKLRGDLRAANQTISELKAVELRNRQRISSQSSEIKDLNVQLIKVRGALQKVKDKRDDYRTQLTDYRQKTFRRSK